jgi:hypothetical protein
MMATVYTDALESFFHFNKDQFTNTRFSQSAAHELSNSMILPRRSITWAKSLTDN